MPAATDGDALMDTIIDDPGNDDLRMVYADWVEEKGDAKRAAFIRESVAAPWDNGRFRKLYDLEVALRYGSDGLDGYLEDSVDHLPVLCEWVPSQKYTPGLIWTRGLISGVQCLLDLWEKVGAEICRRHPIETLIFTDIVPTSVFFGVRRTHYFHGGRLPGGAFRSVIPTEWELSLHADLVNDTLEFTGGWPSEIQAMNALHAFALERAKSLARGVTS